MNPVGTLMVAEREELLSDARLHLTPWGKPTKGYKTRKKNKKSDMYIVRKRK